MSKVVVNILDEQGEQFLHLVEDLNIHPETIQSELRRFLASFSSSEDPSGLRANRRPQISSKEKEVRKNSSIDEELKKYGLRRDYPFTLQEIESILDYTESIVLSPKYQGPWRHHPRILLEHFLAQACDSIEQGVGSVQDQIQFLEDYEGISCQFENENLDPELLAVAIYLQIWAKEEIAQIPMKMINQLISQQQVQP